MSNPAVSGDPLTNEATIPPNYTQLIACELGLQERQLPALLVSTDLTAEQLLQDDMRLSARQQIRVIENALAMSLDPAFGLRLGRRLTPSTHGAMGYLASSSPNLLAALEAFHAFLPTRISFARLELMRSDDWIVCRCHFDIDMSEPVHRCLAETFGMIFFETTEFIIGRAAVEVEASLAHAKPEYVARYREYLPGTFRFSAGELALRIPMSLCEIPNVSANHETYALALAQCEAMMAQLPGTTGSYRERVEKLMLSHPPGVLTEDEAAAALFINKRTLARRLKTEGSGFRQIRDDVLARQAVGYLRDSRLSVDAIAGLLNYHDSANFRRAFKRWYRMTPDQYRCGVNAT